MIGLYKGMTGLYEGGLKTDYIAPSQWDVYCKIERVRHNNINLLDSSMIERKYKRKQLIK